MERLRARRGRGTNISSRTKLLIHIDRDKSTYYSSSLASSYYELSSDSVSLSTVPRQPETIHSVMTQLSEGMDRITRLLRRIVTGLETSRRPSEMMSLTNKTIKQRKAPPRRCVFIKNYTIVQTISPLSCVCSAVQQATLFPV
jgi:hypothetical protein